MMSVEEAEALSGWTAGDIESLEKNESDSEQMLVRIYEWRHSPSEREATRKLLTVARNMRTALLSRRYTLHHATPEGHAAACHAKHLVSLRLLHSDRKTPVFPGGPDSGPADLLGLAAAAAAEARPGEAVVRKLARSEPWRSMWGARGDASGVFKQAASELDPDQLALVGWSKLYEAALSAETPVEPEDLEDDDVFDGWLITRKKAAQERSASDSSRASNASEVYVMAPPGGFKPGDAEAIMQRSGPQGRAIQKAREKAMQERGELTEHELPDVRAEVGMALNRLVASRR